MDHQLSTSDGHSPGVDCRLLAVAGAVALLVFIAFLPCLDAGFVDWDDDKNILENTNFRGLWPTNLWWMLTTTHMGPYQPLNWLTLAVDYCVWGLNPRGYHLTNLLLHAVGAAALCLVCSSVLTAWRGEGSAVAERRSYAPVGILLGSGMASLAWAVHPQHVESVAWVTERRDVLSGVFYFLCIWAYLQAHRSGLGGAWRSGWQRISLVCCGLALLSKATTASLPVVLILLDICPLKRLSPRPWEWLRRSQWHVLSEKVNHVLFCVLAVLVGFVGQSRAGALKSLEQVGAAERLAVAFHSIFFYVGKTVWPEGLSPLYPRPEEIRLTEPRFLWPFLVVIGLTVVGVALARRFPGGLAAWICYVVTLSPVCGFVTIGDELVADRYSYLPTAGLFVLAGGLIWSVWSSPVGGSARRLRQAAVVIVIPIVLFRSVSESRQVMRVWKDSLSLWTHATQQCPESHKAWNNLGAALVKAGSFSQGEEACRKAVSLKPDYATGYHNLGIALIRQGRYREAKGVLEESVRLDPTYARAHGTLGSLLAMWLDEPAGAIEHLETALKLDPKGMVRVHHLLGNAYRTLGQYDTAAQVYRASMRANPRPAHLVVNLAALVDVYLSQDRLDDATTAAEQGLRIAPNAAESQYAMAQVMARRGRPVEAVELLRAAITVEAFFLERSRTDPHLRELRENPVFDRMIGQLSSATKPFGGTSRAAD